MTNKKESLKDINGIELRTGQIVKVEGGFFKSDNGNFKIIHSPGDFNWSGSDYCLYRINKDGSISKAKNKTQFWPLMATVSSQEKRVLAREHNKRYATIEIVKEASTDIQIDEMEKDDLMVMYEQLLEEKEMQSIDGIWKNSTKSEIITAIECLKCLDEELDEYLEIVSKEYPHLVKTIKENPIDFKKHDFNRLHIYIVARELIIENETKESTEQKQDDNKEKTERIDNAEVEISFNEEKNGIEIKFDGKPERAVLENLKANGFRWSRYQKIWYAKDTAERRKFIKVFDAVETKSEPKAFEYPEININDLENYTVSTELSRREHDSNWIFRTKERNHNSELRNVLEHYQNEALKIIDLTDDKATIYYIKRDLQRFKKAYHGNYIALLSNRANNPSWTVTGRAGRNLRRDQQAHDRYNRLLEEYGEIKEKFESQLRKHQGRISRLKTVNMQNSIENTEVEIDFKVETKEIDYIGYRQTVRTYNYKNYMIAKLWGCFRLFKDGGELPKHIIDLRTTDTLSTAKKALQLIINKEVHGIQEVI